MSATGDVAEVMLDRTCPRLCSTGYDSLWYEVPLEPVASFLFQTQIQGEAEFDTHGLGALITQVNMETYFFAKMELGFYHADTGGRCAHWADLPQAPEEQPSTSLVKIKLGPEHDYR
ncbi:hypothetical protein OK016_24005 [Vibrio chagasii]|nr:hypothetical protein [Vibrio chagasii]